MRRANADVIEAAQVKGRHGMGATLTAVLVDQTTAYVAEVGDSRAYLLRAGQLKQLTRDQSLVQMLVDQGLMKPEEAESSPRKNILLQAMGSVDEVHAAIGQVELRQGDKLLICSDGISNAVTHGELLQILARNAPWPACAQLVQLANDRGGEDNLTAVVALFEGNGLPAPVPSETVTGTFAGDQGLRRQRRGERSGFLVTCRVTALQAGPRPLQFAEPGPAAVGSVLTTSAEHRARPLISAAFLVAGAYPGAGAPACPG